MAPKPIQSETANLGSPISSVVGSPISSILDSPTSSEPGSPISETEFERQMEVLGPFTLVERVALAVSGGPDSMALSRLAHLWGGKTGIKITGLTVDHRLRADAAQEAQQVADWFALLGLDHHTLQWWDGDSVGQLDRSPQAAARDARFALMCNWCSDNGVTNLLVAHHADDQAETFLYRLIRGSGVDGLAAMAQKIKREGVTLLRPLLEWPKADLIATCQHYDQTWINDPSNQDDRYTRVRLRKLLSALETEGFSSDRLLNTVTHMQRAKAAIDYAVDGLTRDTVRHTESGALTIDLEGLKTAPDEVGLRCLARCLCQVSGATYPPRFESLLRVYSALSTTDWSDRTLLGCQLRIKGEALQITLEARERQNSR